jgi:ribosomal protein L11 methyltransferase
LFCLQQLVARLKTGPPGSFLDIGTGSGILAIAAARLGYYPIRAIDVDAEAIRVARENAKQNGVLDRIRITRQDLARWPRKSPTQYGLICANLNGDLLLQEADRIVSRLLPAGRLILAGILRRQFAQVRSHFAKAGLRLAASRTGKEWRSGAFVFSNFQMDKMGKISY